MSRGQHKPGDKGQTAKELNERTNATKQNTTINEHEYAYHIPIYSPAAPSLYFPAPGRAMPTLRLYVIIS